MNTEELITHLLLKVEQKFEKPGFGTNQNRDFAKLSSTIFNETSIIISLSTLKRLFGKVNYSLKYKPQQNTLDALSQYVGYEGWEDFLNKTNIEARENNLPEPKIIQSKDSFFLSKKTTFLIIVTNAIVISCFLIWKFYPIISPKPTLTLSVSDTVYSYPSSAKLAYSSSSENDTLSLILNEKTKIKLDGNKGIYTLFFRLPGIVNAQIVDAKGNKSEDLQLYVVSKKWNNIVYKNLPELNSLQSELQPFTGSLEYYYFDSNSFYIDETQIKEVNIDSRFLFHTDHRKFNAAWLKNELNSIEFEFKNDCEIKNVLCDHFIFNTWTKEGKIRFHFLNKGCGSLSLNQFLTVDMTNINFTKFETDMSKWNTFRIEKSIDSTLAYLNGEKISSFQSSGSIHTFGFSFLSIGQGEIRNFKMNSENISAE